jgi:hypothetical protein
MPDVPSGLILLQETADPSFVNVELRLDEAGPFLVATIDWPMPDGEIETFCLLIRVIGTEERTLLKVQEVPELRKLPAGCPDRHINRDGSFCLGWGSSLPLFPTDRNGARGWWKLIVGYLQQQLQAAELRAWPGEAWRHGRAAEFQDAFDVVAGTVPAGVVDIATASKLPSIGPFRIYQRRRPCPCGSGRAIKDCHEPEMVVLSKLEQKMRDAEKAFWRGWSGETCCKTIDNCPLGKAQGQ